MKELFSLPKLKKDGTPGKERYIPPLDDVQRSVEWRLGWIGCDCVRFCLLLFVLFLRGVSHLPYYTWCCAWRVAGTPPTMQRGRGFSVST